MHTSSILADLPSHVRRPAPLFPPSTSPSIWSGVPSPPRQAIEPYKPFFLEEPLPYNNVRGYAALAAATSVPVAGGECLTSLEEFGHFARAKALDVVQPDAAFTCGWWWWWAGPRRLGLPHDADAEIRTR